MADTGGTPETREGMSAEQAARADAAAAAMGATAKELTDVRAFERRIMELGTSPAPSPDEQETHMRDVVDQQAELLNTLRRDKPRLAAIYDARGRAVIGGKRTRRHRRRRYRKTARRTKS